jgi:hypothetical protein
MWNDVSSVGILVKDMLQSLEHMNIGCGIDCFPSLCWLRALFLPLLWRYDMMPSHEWLHSSALKIVKPAFITGQDVW